MVSATANPRAAAAAAPAENDDFVIAPRPQINKWLVTVSITFGTLMGAIDTSIVNVAIPHLRGALGASVDEITWVSTGYIIANVIIMPLTAWLGVRFGRKNIYQFCMALFVVGSIFCGLARSLPVLVFFRVIQGIGAGGLQPTEQAILRETFPVEEQAMAMAVFGLAVMIGPAVGPTLGGWIIDNSSWPWIFYVNVPIGFIGLMMVQRFVHDPPHLIVARRKAKGTSADMVGIVLLAAGLGCLQYVLERGDREDWLASHFILILSVVAAIAMAFFILRELTTEHPAVDLSILKYGTYTAGTLIGAVLGVALFGSLFMLPLFFQELLGHSATQAGLELMPRTLAMVLVMPIAGALFNKMGARLMIFLGLLVGGLAAWSMSHFTLDSSSADLIIPQIIQGFGFSFVFVALSTTTLAVIPRERMSAATGLYNVVRNLGGSVGTVIIAVLFERYTTSSHAQLETYITAVNPLAMQRLVTIQQALKVRMGYSSFGDALQLMNFTLERQATLLAFERVFAVIAIVFFISLPLVFLLPNFKPGKRAKPMEHVE
jgi:DHA2 family multidrug resistance protein